MPNGVESATKTEEQFTTQFDSKLLSIPHYQQHPQMLPFVGSHYGEYGPRILILGESHYLRKNSTVHLDAEQWYQTHASQLSAHDYSHTNTRKCLTKPGKSWKSKSYTIYRNIENALLEVGYPKVDNTLRYVAFMNTYQRPARSRLSIHGTPEDELRSLATIQAVIDMIQPEHIIFVSRKAYLNIGKKLKQTSFAVPHPASAWWNRSSKRGTGKEQMLALLRRLHAES